MAAPTCRSTAASRGRRSTTRRPRSSIVIDIDNQYPYRVYGTQQDNTSISVPSASEWGVITLADCSYPGTGESGFIAVDPRDHNIVYVGAVGSSPGGAGALQRYDHRTRQIQLVNVWPEESTASRPRT